MKTINKYILIVAFLIELKANYKKKERYLYLIPLSIIITKFKKLKLTPMNVYHSLFSLNYRLFFTLFYDKTYIKTSFDVLIPMIISWNINKCCIYSLLSSSDSRIYGNVCEFKTWKYYRKKIYIITIFYILASHYFQIEIKKYDFIYISFLIYCFYIIRKEQYKLGHFKCEKG